MTWYPTSYVPVQFEDAAGVPYSGAVLKAYSAGTTTVIPMATGIDGATTATSFALNASGYPVTSGGAVIIPHVQENFKLALYPDQASADANSGEIWSVDDIEIAITATTAFVEAFSGDGATTAFVTSQDLGTDENTLMIFVKEDNVGFFDTFSGDGATTVFALSVDCGTDEKAIEVLIDKGLQEHVTNGTFATDTGWTKGADWTIGAGVATCAGASNTDISQTTAITLVQGVAYEVEFDLTRSAGSIVVELGGTAGTSRNATGTYKEIVIAGATQTLNFNTTGFTGTLDNVTVKRISLKGYDVQHSSLYTVNGTSLTFATAPPTGTGNIYVRRPVKSGTGAMSILSPQDYTINGTALTFDTAPPLGTNNILVFAPSLLFGAVGALADAAATSETNAAASALLASQWATLTTGIVAATDYSSKAWAIGGTGVTATAARGASKEWATKTTAAVDTTEFSAKEYAQGTQAATGGSAKSWAQVTGADVTGAAANSRSAKSWAQDVNTGATLGGSAKDWAQTTGGTVDGTGYSSKEHAVGTTTATGSAKDWATKTSAAVTAGNYSAKEWATGTQTRGAASGGSAKDWATYTGGTVDNAEYSAKYWAQQSATSASNAATSETNAAASAAAAAASYAALVGTYPFALTTVNADTNVTMDSAYKSTKVGLTTYTIPVSVAVGKSLQIYGYDSGGWKIQLQAGQTIVGAGDATTSGGSLASTNQYDNVTIRCLVADTLFTIENSYGSLTTA